MILETTLQPFTIVICLFFPFFIGMWVLVTFILSRMGWAPLAKQYRYDEEFTGTNLGAVSATINLVNYKHTLLIQYNAEGIYLRPVFLFRLFHKPLLIPWKEIKDVRDKQLLFFTYKELFIGDPLVARIRISQATYAKLEPAYREGLAKSRGYN